MKITRRQNNILANTLRIKNTNTMEWSPYMKVKRFLDESYPEYASSLLDSLSDGQYESKRWMCEILDFLIIPSSET